MHPLRRAIILFLALGLIAGGAVILLWILLGGGWYGYMAIGAPALIVAGAYIIYEDFIKPVAPG